MNEETRYALAAVNRRFYERHAEGFSSSRERPWPGWSRVADLTERGGAISGGRLRVLDLGCGNGRFASYLADRRAGKDCGIDYWGVDSSPELLAAARKRLAEITPHGRMELRWCELDLSRADLRRHLGAASFHLIALYGVLHHIPGRDWRSGLLARAAAHLAPHGVLAATVWRFDRHPRWPRKVVPWSDYNRRAPEPIDLAEIESGDHLLTWAGDRETPRYCHLADDAEVAELIEAVDVPCIELFTADGPGGDRNTYLVLGTDLRPQADAQPRAVS